MGLLRAGRREKTVQNVARRATSLYHMHAICQNCETNLDEPASAYIIGIGAMPDAFCPVFCLSCTKAAAPLSTWTPLSLIVSIELFSNPLHANTRLARAARKVLHASGGDRCDSRAAALIVLRKRQPAATDLPIMYPLMASHSGRAAGASSSSEVMVRPLYCFPIESAVTFTAAFFHYHILRSLAFPTNR